MGVWLVHQEDAGLLNQRSGNHHALPFAAAKVAERAIREVANAQPREATADHFGVFANASPQPPAWAKRPNIAISRTENGTSTGVSCGTTAICRGSRDGSSPPGVAHPGRPRRTAAGACR